MNMLIEKSKYLSLIAVVTLLLTFALALFWGVAQAVQTWVRMFTSYGTAEEITVKLIKLIDAFLLAAILYMLAASIYKLFIGDLNLSNRVVAGTLPELKTKLSSVIVLVIAVRFTEFLFENTMQPEQVFWMGAAAALVIAALVAFIYLGGRNDNHEEP
ncbi:MAG TPA: YqhA family protein [Anaerolineaceae bacterium]